MLNKQYVLNKWYIIFVHFLSWIHSIEIARFMAITSMNIFCIDKVLPVEQEAHHVEDRSAVAVVKGHG